MAYPSQKEIERDPQLREGSRSDSERKAESEPHALEGEGQCTPRAGCKELPTCCPRAPGVGQTGPRASLNSALRVRHGTSSRAGRGRKPPKAQWVVGGELSAFTFEGHGKRDWEGSPNSLDYGGCWHTEPVVEGTPNLQCCLLRAFHLPHP